MLGCWPGPKPRFLPFRSCCCTAEGGVDRPDHVLHIHRHSHKPTHEEELAETQIASPYIQRDYSEASRGSTAGLSRRGGGPAGFKELLRLLQEEHDRVDQLRELLASENSKLVDENSRLRLNAERDFSNAVVSEVPSRRDMVGSKSSTSRPWFGPSSTCEAVSRLNTEGKKVFSQVVSSASGAPVQVQSLPTLSEKDVVRHTDINLDARDLNSVGHQESMRGRRRSLPMNSTKTNSQAVQDGPKKVAFVATPQNGNKWSTGPSKANHQSYEELYERADFTRVLGPLDKDSYMISPVSHFRLSWDFFAFSCLLADLWFTPLELVFMAEEIVPQGFAVLNVLITIFFVIDIALNFNTGFIDRDKLVMQRRASIKRYTTFWFWIDLLATLPFELIVKAILSNSGADVLNMTRLARLTKITKVLKTLRFLRVLRAMRLIQQIDRADSFLEVYQILKYWFKLFQLLTGLAFMAHLHGCIYALLHSNMSTFQDMDEAVHNYYKSFRWAYNAITVGNMSFSLDEPPGVWALEMIIASERILIILFVGGWGIVKALTMFQEDAQLTLVKNAAVGFFRQHSVSIETQISVMYSLHETRAAQKLQRHFKSLMSEHLPDELRRTVSEELWVPHLNSLGLITHITHWNQDFVTELALLVREEVVASKTILCKEGHPSIATYHILKGRLMVASTHFQGDMPDFTDGMWVEETALISPVRRRSSTVVTPILTRLMTVPTQDFHELVVKLGLEGRFHEFRETALMSGLCGRCGEIGDHFTHACPKAWMGHSGHTARRRRSFGLTTPPHTQLSLGWHEGEGSDRSLDAFLHAHRLQILAPLLQEQRIHSQEDLAKLDYEALDEQLAGQEELRKGVSLLQRLVEEQQEQAALEEEGEVMSSQHLAFLSHFKLESGTEAALMRAELERVLSEDDHSAAHRLDTPIFLDSEDLSDLEELEEHVRRSHNLVLLLTQNVLLRPWVLVEIVTAVEAEVRVVPVEVSRKGARFTFPDERYYARLVNGKVLDSDGQALLRERGIDLRDVERALREVFNKIAMPYSPHRSEGIRLAEIRAIYKQLLFKGSPRPSDYLGATHQRA